MTVFDFIEKFILFVIPGTITYSLACYLTGKKPQQEWICILYIFIASIISFVIGNLWLMLLNLLPCLNFHLVDITQVLSGNSEKLSTSGFLSALFSSFLICIVITRILDGNLLFRFINWLHISHRTDNDEVWDYMFDRQPWIIVRDLVTGNTYYGYVVKYSDGGSIRELLLEDVAVWSVSDGDYSMEQVYIARNPSEIIIEIDDYTKEMKNDGGPHAKNREIHSTAK